eukprot:Pgem_evm1s5050
MGPEDGYSQSKWVAEKIICNAIENGADAYIYRLGRITGESKLGVGNTNDYFSSLIKGNIQLRFAFSNYQNVDLTPVDYVVDSILEISTYSSHNHIDYKIFHINNPNPANWKNIIEILNEKGYIVEFTDFNIWRKKVFNNDTALNAFLTLYDEDPQPDPLATCTNTISILEKAKTGVVCPVGD